MDGLRLLVRAAPWEKGKMMCFCQTTVQSLVDGNPAATGQCAGADRRFIVLFAWRPRFVSYSMVLPK